MKLGFKTKLSYGIGGLADNAMFALSGTYLLFFLTTVAGIKPATAGTIVAMGSVWEAFCGPISGYLSDNTQTRFGKRKPFILIAAFPVAIATSLLFTTIGASYGIKVVYYAVMTIMYWWSFAVFFVPFMAWGSELTEDYNERTVIRTFVYVFNQLGMALGMVLPTILVDFLVNLGKTTEASWSMVGITIGVLSCGSLLICALTIKNSDVKDFKKDPNRESPVSVSKILAMFKEYLQILQLRPIKYIIGASLMYLIANIIFSSDRVYYLTFNMSMPATTVSLIMLIIPVLGISISPLVAKISEKTDKRLAFMWGIGGTGVVMILLGIILKPTLIGACLICAVYAVGNTCYWQLMPSMIYDVCEAEELYHGEKHSGAVISLQALSESLSSAVGVQILGVILQTAGFVDSAKTQGETALAWISHSYTIIPGIAMVIVAFLISRYPINKKTFPRIMAAVERQRAGKTVDLNDFKDVF